MKLRLLVIIISLFSATASAGPFKAMKSINCQYSVNGGAADSVVHTGNKTKTVHGQEDDFDSVVEMHVSVAYILNGKRFLESASVLRYDVEGDEDNFDSIVTIEAQTAKDIKIKFKNWGGKSTMTVNGQEQTHMTGLTCQLGLGA